MSKIRRGRIASIFAFAYLLGAWNSFAQTGPDSLALSSGTPSGGSVSLNLTLTSPSGSQPAALEWTLSYSTSAVSSISATAGAALTAAGDTLTCQPGNGTYTCLAYGMTTALIQNGVVAVVNVTLASGASSATIGVTSPVAASSAGASIPATATGGSVTGGGSTASLSSLSCQPSTLNSGSTATCTATLSAAAPSGGALVTLTNPGPAYFVVPASVTVPANSTSNTFTISAGSITTGQNVTISGSYNGTAAATITLSNSQYVLTTAASPAAGGTVTPASGGAYNPGTVVNLTATANTGYQFSGWTGPVAGSSSPVTTVTMSAAESVTANFTALPAVTIQTSPTGLQFSVDGGTVQTAPQTLYLSAGTHTVAVTGTQAGPTGTQYVFSSWSDGGAASHAITVGGTPATYTASFTTQYKLTTASSPAAGGTATPASGSYYNSGQVVNLAATAAGGYQFTNWTGSVASPNSASTSVTMSAPQTVTANFAAVTAITVQTSPTGLQFTVDGGAAQTAPQTLSLAAGSHTIAVAATQPGATGTQYVFGNWSDGGAASHTITVGSSPVTYTATFTTQYRLTTAASPAAGGTVSPASGAYYNAGQIVNLSATAGSSYQFSNWTGNVASPNSASTTVTMSAAQSVTANFSSLSGITIQTSPAGLQFSVDNGPAQTAPQTLNLTAGSHTIAVAATQAGAAGTQYVFGSWSDSGNAAHSIIVGSSPATYTATFTTQYQLTVSASPAAGGTVTPATGTYYNAAAVVNLSATAAAGYQFANWTGSVASPNSASTTVSMTGPQTVAANFSAVTGITIQTSPSGLQFSVDGGALQTAPQTLSLTTGSHTIAVATTQAGPAGTQYAFSGWSDGGAASHPITVGTSAASYTASFTTQYQLTVNATPAGGGTVTPAGAAYYAAGSPVTIKATPASGYVFQNWSGNNITNVISATTTVTLSGAETVTANFTALTGVTIQTSPAGLQFAVDGGAAQTAPQTLNLAPGSHTVAVAATQSGTPGTQYVFSNWSDSGAASHTITVGSSPSTYTAAFTTQYQLTSSASPAAGGSVTPASGGYYNAGTVVNLSATAASGYQFVNWSGPVTAANIASTTVTMSAPETVTANFNAMTGVTIQTSPAGLQFTVDGGAVQIAPQTVSLTPGNHTIAVTATQNGTPGTQYLFSNWSDNGGASHVITVGSSPATYTATFTPQYQLTISASPAFGGSVTPPVSSYYPSGAVVNLSATPNSGYQFSSWSGAVASPASAATTITMSAPQTVTGNFASLTGVTIQTNPAGLQFTVDGGAALIAPQTLNLTAGAHTIAVAATQSGPAGTQYVFANWSDGGALSHSITVGSAAASYMATFTTQYQLNISPSPAAGGVVNPVSGAYYNAGTVVNLSAVAAGGYQFSSWTGPVASPNSASTTITMSAVETISANFLSLTGITIQTSPSGLPFTVDGGAAQTAPQTLNLSPGTHTIAVAATQAGTTGTQYVFSGWSDGGGASHLITVGSSAVTYTASFATQYLLTTASSPAAGGTVSPASGTYYNARAVVNLTATPAGGYQFSSWSGPVGSPNSAVTTVTMADAESVTANFVAATGITIQTVPAGLQFTVDGGAAQTAPQTLSLSPGAHAIAVVATQAGAAGTQYVFTSWSDGGAASHSITVGTTAAVYTASFTTQYQLTISGSPAAGGTVSPATGGYYNSGAVVNVSATPASGYQFNNWTGSVAAANSAATTVAMSAPQTVTANFLATSGVTVQTAPPGLQFNVDGGASQTAPQVLNLSPGQHTISVLTTQSGVGNGGGGQQGASTQGTQYVFTAWSDGGAASHAINVGTGAASYTASFATQYQLTVAASPAAGGSATPSVPTYFSAGVPVTITAQPASGYAFQNWSGAGIANPTSASTTVTLSASETVTANFTALSGTTIQTSPAGLQITVDGGAPLTAPQTLNLSSGAHTIAVATTQTGPGGAGTQYVFGSWSDGGAASHSITVGSTAATYTANFTTQYQLNISASPAAGGTVIPAASGYYNAGTVVNLTATAAGGYQFGSWTGPVAGANNASTTVTMSGPETVAANFASLTGTTIQTTPPGLQFTVDGGAPQLAPQVLNLTAGTHTIAVATTQAGAPGTQYVFSAWSDGLGASHSITVTATPATFTATFTVQHQLTITVTPSSAGSVVSNPPSASGYYDEGTSVQLTASPRGTNQFTGWAGDLSGSTSPISIAMSTSHNVTAMFSGNSCSLSLTPTTNGMSATGTSAVMVCPNNSGQPNCGVTPEFPVSFTVMPSAGCGAWTATSSNPGVVQITSGASGTGVGTVSYTMLTNTHSTAQNYTITVASASSSAVYSVSEAGSGNNETYRQVYALYEQLLGRDPDPSGFTFWTGAGGAALGQMADSFITSGEAFNSDFAVMAAYQAATGGAPTYAQFTAAVTSIRAGSQTVAGLFNSLAASNANYSAATLYQNLLNRQPTPAETSQATGAGLASWMQTLIGYPTTVSPIGAANNEFQNTGTYQGKTAPDHTNALYVDMLYFAILGRDPDPTGLAFWIGIANSGGPGILFQGKAGYPTRLQILGPGTAGQGFIGSPEFQGLFVN